MIEVRLRGQPPEPSAAWDAARRLAQRVLERHALALCDVTVNSNRRRLLWWRITTVSASISAHWSIVPHTDEVMDVLDGKPGAWNHLRRHVPTAPLPPLRAAGRFHDLAALLDAEAVHVPDAPEVDVTWGRWPARPPRRVLRLGSCDRTLIRIHPVLDDESVPDWFVGFVLFHELLHAAMPAQVVGGRRQIHPASFRSREATHPRYAEALAWEERHITRLLDRVRSHLDRRRS